MSVTRRPRGDGRRPGPGPPPGADRGGTRALAAGIGLAARSVPAAALVAVNLGCLGILVAGFGIVRRPKDSLTLLATGVAALLAGVATDPEWDSIRLMQWVMAGLATAAGLLVLLPQTYQRVAVSLFVLYHFAGVISAITSPDPRPWLTSQLWARVPPAPGILVRQQRLPVLFAAARPRRNPLVLPVRRARHGRWMKSRAATSCSTHWRSSTTAGCR